MTNRPLIWTSIVSVTCSEPIIQAGNSTPTSRAPKTGAEGLLHDQAQSPGRQQGIERTRVEALDQRPFDQQSERAGGEEGNDHRDEEISGDRAPGR